VEDSQERKDLGGDLMLRKPTSESDWKSRTEKGLVGVAVLRTVGAGRHRKTTPHRREGGGASEGKSAAVDGVCQRVARKVKQDRTVTIRCNILTNEEKEEC